MNSRLKGYLAVIFGILRATIMIILGITMLGGSRINLGMALIVMGVLFFALVIFYANKYNWDIPDSPSGPT